MVTVTIVMKNTNDLDGTYNKFFKMCKDNNIVCEIEAISEPTYSLTKAERIILENIITDNYKYIHRDGNGSLWITEDVWLEPKKDPMLKIPYRESNNIFWFGMYRHLFQFIKNGQEISIKELLGDDEQEHDEFDLD